MVSKPVVISLNKASQFLCDKIAYAFGPQFKYVWLDGKPAKEVIQGYFREKRPIIGLCSSAILIRILAPLLQDKLAEPPVVAIAPDASAIVPLLGGHHGANRIAREIGAYFEIEPAITNASDTLLGVEFDNPPEGWTLADSSSFKHKVSSIANDPRVSIRGYAPWLLGGKLVITDDAPNEIVITERAQPWNHERLVYYPRTLAVGFGCERGITSQEVEQLFNKTLHDHGLACDSVGAFASIDLKDDEEGFTSAWFGGRMRFFTREELSTFERKVPNPSEIVKAGVGVASVAEAAALAAAGPNADLIVEKTKSERATIAIARSPRPILFQLGRERAKLFIVGVGPGTPWQRTYRATEALRVATDWVGYSLYLDLVSEIRVGKVEHRFPLGGEEDRVRHAIELAKQGKRVALICSGDAGIYAMAALVYEMIDKEPCRVSVEVVPGISAFQAAAAKAGAMIGHDFCCISLSDLLTPWPDIERRIKAAAEGDFVISFYNPRSLKRRDQIGRAMEILRPWRLPATPVVIASELGRPKEKLRIIRFDEFNPEDVDMLTLVMVGSSQSRAFKRGDGKTYAYTPRGYATKGTLG